MSTIPQPNSTAGANLRRIVSVTRLHLTQRFTLLVLPLIILGFIFLVSYIIWVILFTALGLADAIEPDEGIQVSGGSLFIFVYMMIVAVQAVNLTFPFALGYGVTRRDFFLGTSLAFVLLSVYYATIMTVLAAIERATGGWGIGGSMFDVIYFGAESALQQFALFLLLFLFFFFLGAATASVYVRWKAPGMYVFFASLTLILLGLVALATTTESWPLVGEWLVTNGAMGVAAWSLVPTTLSAIAGFLILRRATPKN